MMNSGRLTVIVIVGVTLIFGVGVWYSSTRAYYAPLETVEVNLQRSDGSFVTVDITEAQGIDADTSPLRYRACFVLQGVPDMTEALAYDDPTPLIAPNWFDCFDAIAIGTALEQGQATAYLGTRNIHRGVDRVVAIFPDGRGFVWHQLNGTLE